MNHRSLGRPIGTTSRADLAQYANDSIPAEALARARLGAIAMNLQLLGSISGYSLDDLDSPENWELVRDNHTWEPSTYGYQKHVLGLSREEALEAVARECGWPAAPYRDWWLEAGR